MGAGETTQQIRALPAFPEEPGTSLSTHMEAYNHQLTTAPGVQMPSSGPIINKRSHSAQIYMREKYLYT